MCSGRGWCLAIVAVLVLGATGGVLVWQFYPDQAQNTLNKLRPGLGDRFRNATDTGLGLGGNVKDTLEDTIGGGDSNVNEEFTKYSQCDENDLANCCNGLGNICDLPFNDILFPTVHNSMSTVEDGFPSLFGQGANHKYSLERALEAGYRGLSIDVCNCGQDEDRYQLCHGICDLAPRDPVEVFRSIVDFLNANPTEIVMLNIELNNNAEMGGKSVDLFQLHDLVQDGIPELLDLVYVQPNQVSGAPWPTLRQLRDSNQRLVLFHYNGPTCTSEEPCPPGWQHWYTYAQDTQFQIGTIESMRDIDSCQITRGSGQGFFAVTHFLTLPQESAASTINDGEFVQQRLQDCSDYNNGLVPNVLLVDFWSVGDVLEVTQQHNKALGAAAAAAVQQQTASSQQDQGQFN